MRIGVSSLSRWLGRNSEAYRGPRRLVEREPRHSVQAYVIYRRPGGPNWISGTLDNVSHSGVFFHGEHCLPVDSPVELSFTLPQEVRRKGEGNIFCWGKIARAEPSQDNASRPALAVKIERYRSEPPRLADVRSIVGEW